MVFVVFEEDGDVLGVLETMMMVMVMVFAILRLALWSQLMMELNQVGLEEWVVVCLEFFKDFLDLTLLGSAQRSFFSAQRQGILIQVTDLPGSLLLAHTTGFHNKHTFPI